VPEFAPSLAAPKLYAETNINGTLNLLELARDYKVPQFVFGSSSSVYGINSKVPVLGGGPYSTKPSRPYAATKAAGELLCHTYSHLFNIPMRLPALLSRFMARGSGPILRSTNSHG
jgi:UDP-glucuronate 4-epimerase